MAKPRLHADIRALLRVHETLSAARLASMLNKREDCVRKSLHSCFGVYIAHYESAGCGAWTAQWKLVEVPPNARNPRHMKEK